jgi:hypothetical protein
MRGGGKGREEDREYPHQLHGYLVLSCDRASASPHPGRKSRSPPRIDSPIGSQQGSPLRSPLKQYDLIPGGGPPRSR